MMSLVFAVLLIILLICLLMYFLMLPVYLFPSRKRTKSIVDRLPGPKGLPVLGLAIEIASLRPDEVFGFFGKLCSDYPRLVKFWVSSTPCVILQDPEDLKVVLKDSNFIRKGLEYYALLPWLKEGLLVSRGNKWRTRRKLLTNTFHFKILEDNIGSLNRNSKILVRNMLQTGGSPFNVDPLVGLCAMDVICETAMGISINAQNFESQSYVNSVKRVSQLTVHRLCRFWMVYEKLFRLSSEGREFYKNLEFLHDFTEKIIVDRKANYQEKMDKTDDDTFGKPRRAFLDSMIEMDRKQPNSFTNSDIREEVDTFMFEGHDTTSAALTFGMYLLGRHPHVQEKMLRELNDIFGDEDRETTMQDLQKMVYTEQVVYEILRLYPSVPYISRFLGKDMMLDGNVTVPKGTNVVIIPYLVHRDAKYFKNPEEFDPDRFATDEFLGRHPFSYIPFSAGPRNCIGKKFAMMELKTVLAAIVRSMTIETITKPEEIKLVPYLILRSSTPIMIRVKPRSP